VTGLYLLLVENNYISSRDIKSLFEANKIGCEVVNTSSSKSLIDLAQKLTPEFVIVDFDFFNDDPVSIIKELRHRTPHAYIIAFADPDFYQDLGRAIEAGVNDYLIKPLQREDVLIRIKMGLHQIKAASAGDKEADGAVQHLEAYQKSEHKIRAIMGDRVMIGSAPAPVTKIFATPGKVSFIGQAREKSAIRAMESDLADQSRAFQDQDIHPESAETDPIDRFEALVTKAKMIDAERPNEAIKMLSEALILYQSEYLQDLPSSGNRSFNSSGQHELYIGAVLDLADLLSTNKEQDQLIKLCEEAMKIDYFEEGLHIRLIEALLAKGETSRALAHYDEATSAFYKEMGLTPSADLKKVYEKIQGESDNPEIELNIIQAGLNGKELPEGALYCDADQFRFFYKLEQLRGERSGQSVLLCMLVPIAKDYSKPSDNLLQEVMQNLKSVIMQTLRKGDLFTNWHEGQFLLLLPGLNREQAAEVLDRIERAYSRMHSLQGLVLQKKIETIFPLEGDSHFN
jgi:DNA-binding NarL/FixJ family response regulator